MGVDQLVTGGDVNDPVVNSVTTDALGIGSASQVTGGPVGDVGEIIPGPTIPVKAGGNTFSTNSTTYVVASEADFGFVVFGLPPTNANLKMRFAGDVDVEPADIKFGLGDQSQNFDGSYGDAATTTSAEVTAYSGRSPQPTAWFDVDDNARGQPLVKVKQPDGNDVFIRSMMVQFGYEVSG